MHFKNNFVNKKNDFQVIDLTDSLSEIPEEILRQNNFKNETNPSDKMKKYLENGGCEKMSDFSAKKNEISILEKNRMSEILSEQKNRNSDLFDYKYDYNNFPIEKKTSNEMKFNSLKFNNYNTDSYLNINKNNENEKNYKDDLYNYVNSDENEYIEDETLIKKKNSKENNQEENSTKKSESQDIKILKTSNNVFIEGSKTDLKLNDHVYDGSIKILKYISEGAQAKVYLGLIEEIGKYVAIKRYSIIENDDDLISKINAECEFIKSLDHPNIIKYYDIELNERNNFTTIDLIMEYVDGLCLKDYVNSEDFIYLDKEEKNNMIKFIIKNILNGIAYLHSNKIIHRDLKVNYFFF